MRALLQKPLYRISGFPIIKACHSTTTAQWVTFSECKTKSEADAQLLEAKQKFGTHFERIHYTYYK